ncbi:MAG: hypothetical protein JWO80_5579 [Bryobacterales bacterium]|nr:hypothetical protein [Bryobacterales bacterium]
MTGLTKIALALIAAGACFAQNPAPPAPSPEARKFFRLEFSVKELEANKVINSRKYFMTILTGANRSGGGASSIRSGNKVPVRSGSSTSPLTSTQFTYVDIGVNIDCGDANIVDGGLSLVVTSDITNSIASPEPNMFAPIIRTNKWSSSVIVPLRKATVVFSSDDPATNHQMQLELTATPIT